MRVAFAAFVACAAFGTSFARAADAVDAERLTEARALMKAMDLEKQLDAMMGVMSQELSKIIMSAGGTAGSNPRVAQIIVTESMAVSKENAVRPGGLLDMVAQLYAQRLSLDDLRALRTFHESPAAKHLQEATPELMQTIIQRSMVMNRETLPGLCTRVKQRLQRESLKEAETFGCPAVWS